MKKLVLFLFIIIPLYSQNLFNVEFDFAQFKADSLTNIIELYYQYTPDQFEKGVIDGELSITQKMIFSFTDLTKNKTVLIDTVFSSQNLSELDNFEKLNEIVGVHKVLLPEGNYSLSIELYDFFDESNSVRKAETIIVKPYSNNISLISDLQLARTLNKADENSVFTKNTLNVVPNPNAVYSSEIPLLNYYSELYNISRQNLKLSTFLVYNNSDVVYQETSKLETKNNSIVNVDQINLLKYPSGIYTLQVILTDSTNDYAFASQKQFYYYNKHYTKSVDESTSPKSISLNSQFSFLSEEECDELFEQSRYIATKMEKEQYEKLSTVESKREFLNQFWDKRNKAGSSIKLEYDEYIGRVSEANKLFRGITGPGYKTERGRVFITYGEPERIERYPNESNLKPYEIWYYDSLEGGVIFVFGDLTGLTEYELIHSTKRGEIFDDTWQRRLYIY